VNIWLSQRPPSQSAIG